MECSDFMTRLPPRKRLLVGLKSTGPSCNVDTPLHPAPCDIGTHVRDLINSKSASMEEIVSNARAAAEAALEAAGVARAFAFEKASIAAKARAAVKSALDLLDSVSGVGATVNDKQVKPKLKKKHVPVKLLYKQNGHGESEGVKSRNVSRTRGKETDEGVARTLHHAMNSSPRFNSKVNKPHTYENGTGQNDDACNGIARSSSRKSGLPNSGTFGKIGQLNNGNLSYKSAKSIVLCSKPDILEEGDSSEEMSCSPEVTQSGEFMGNKSNKKRKLNKYIAGNVEDEIGGVIGDRKTRAKRKI